MKNGNECLAIVDYRYAGWLACKLNWSKTWHFAILCHNLAPNISRKRFCIAPRNRKMDCDRDHQRLRGDKKSEREVFVEVSWNLDEK